MITDRRDLRPMAMAARDVRPGMVLLRQRLSGPSRPETIAAARLSGQIVRWELTSGERFTTGADSTLDIVGEDVPRGGYIDPGDILAGVGGKWASVPSREADAIITDQSRPIVRAYIDPAWELEQAQRYCAGERHEWPSGAASGSPCECGMQSLA